MAAEVSSINAVQLKPMAKPMESADSTQMASSLEEVPEVASGVHSRVTGARSTRMSLTAATYFPSLGSLPSCTQRWVMRTRFCMTFVLS